MIKKCENGKSLHYFSESSKVLDESPRDLYTEQKDDGSSLHATSEINQLKVLLRRGYIKAKRDEVNYAQNAYIILH